MMIADKIGIVIGVPDKSFAKAIESTHKVYHSVMDSNLKTSPNYTAYIEKNDLEDHMSFGGGYVVAPNEKH
jgi:hypothetical protein